MGAADATTATTAQAPLRIALTGGIASGKTTVANLFAERGVAVIDTDVIAREVVEPGHAALGQVVQAFGPEILAPDGRIDRRRMRERIFADSAARKRLEAILHPAIRAEMERQSLAAPGPYQVLVIPLLAEGGRRDHVDRVLVVDVTGVAAGGATDDAGCRHARAGPGVAAGAGATRSAPRRGGRRDHEHGSRRRPAATGGPVAPPVRRACGREGCAGKPR